MTGIPERELSIVLLSPRYNLSTFDSGDAELNDFLQHDALAIGYAMDSPLGCRYLVVDPKEGALGFYERFGFRFWTKSRRRMFLNMRDVSGQMQMNESLDLWAKSNSQGP